MKKFLAGLLVLIVSFYSSVCFSEENQQSKFQVSLGIKSFLNKWEASDMGSENGIIAGPCLKIGYDNIFAGISYLASLKSYDNKYTYQEYDGKYIYKSDADVSIDRNDIDIIIGYMFHPRIGIFGGYKYIKYDVEGKGKINSYNNYGTLTGTGTIKYESEMKSKGPAIGFTVNYPLPIKDLILAGSLTYMKLDHDYDSKIIYQNGYTINDNDSNDGSGYSIEPGVVYLINEHISLNAGLKYQVIQYDGGDDDKFTGISLGCDYRF